MSLHDLSDMTKSFVICLNSSIGPFVRDFVREGTDLLLSLVMLTGSDDQSLCRLSLQELSVTHFDGQKKRHMIRVLALKPHARAFPPQCTCLTLNKS